VIAEKEETVRKLTTGLRIACHCAMSSQQRANAQLFLQQDMINTNIIRIAIHVFEWGKCNKCPVI